MSWAEALSGDAGAKRIDELRGSIPPITQVLVVEVVLAKGGIATPSPASQRRPDCRVGRPRRL